MCTQTTAGLIPQPGIAVATKVNQQVHQHNKWLAQCSKILLNLAQCSKILLNLHFSMPSQMLRVLPSQMLCTLQVKCYVYFQVKCYVLYKSNVMCTSKSMYFTSQMLCVLPSQCTLQVKCYVYFQVKCYVLYKSNVMCTLA